MKPAPFEYFAPSSLEEALDKLAELGYGGKVLAGGQSLIPAMNFRMAQPAALVDMNHVSELFYIKPAPDGGLLIGTMTRTSVVEHDPVVAQKFPFIIENMPHIGHAQIRNRGTFGGAMAHADPAGQLPGAAVALNMRFLIKGKGKERWVNAEEFFIGPFMTVIEPEEMLTEVHLPPLPPRTGTAYQQISRQQGSQAQVGVDTIVTLEDNGRIKAARVVLTCVGEMAIYAREASAMLVGEKPSDALFEAAGETAAQREIDPGTDIHATAEYRRSVSQGLVKRALTAAVDRAK